VNRDGGKIGRMLRQRAKGGRVDSCEPFHMILNGLCGDLRIMLA